jgi:hypothetical protein
MRTVSNYFFFNSSIFKGADEYDDNINNVCAVLKYPSTEIRATGLTGY